MPLVLALVLAALAFVRLQPWDQVDVPPDSASPQDVVQAYLEASASKDRSTIEALVIDDIMVPSWSDLLLGRGAAVDHVRIKAPVRDRRGEARTYQQGVYVPVDLTVTDGASDGFSDGPQTWGYLLVRNADTEPWRIIDQGV